MTTCQLVLSFGGSWGRCPFHF